MKKSVIGLAILLTGLALTSCSSSNPIQHPTNNSTLTHQLYRQETDPPDTFISSLLEKYPQYFEQVVAAKDRLNVQVIYTRIDRDKKAKKGVRFTEESFNVNPG